MQYNNGLKFSFSLLSQATPSSHSTPKFPSIEIQKQIQEKHREAKSIPKQQPIMITYSPPSASKARAARPESKGKRILEKYSHLTLLTQREKSEKDSRSVRSAQSSKSHQYHRSKTEASQSLAKTVKNRHYSLSSANLNAHITQLKSKTKAFSHRKEPLKIESTIEPYKGRLFDERSVGKLLNNYIDHRKTPKAIKIPEQAPPLSNIPDKGKSFKSILHKTRPVLKLGSRLLSNHRLEQMSRPIQIPEDFNQY